MITYYHVNLQNYQYNKIYCYINTYFLIKEGWISCDDYRKDPNDSHYTYSGTVNRKDFCYKREQFEDSEMFENINDAKDFAYKKLEKFYQEESLKLLKAYNGVIKEIKNHG